MLKLCIILSAAIVAVNLVTAGASTPCVTRSELRTHLVQAGWWATESGGYTDQKNWRTTAYEIVLAQYEGRTVCDGITVAK